MSDLKTVKEYCQYKFTADEKAAIGNDLAEKTGEANRLEERKKAIVKDFGGQIDVLRNACSTLAQNLREGYEYRDIDCDVEKDFKNRKVTHRRIDTFEVARIRNMTADELQLEIPTNEKGCQDD